MDHQQALRQFDAHDFEGDAVAIIPQEHEPFIDLPLRRRDPEHEPAVFDNEPAASRSYTVLGRRPRPSDLLRSEGYHVLSDRTRSIGIRLGRRGYDAGVTRQDLGAQPRGPVARAARPEERADWRGVTQKVPARSSRCIVHGRKRLLPSVSTGRRPPRASPWPVARRAADVPTSAGLTIRGMRSRLQPRSRHQRCRQRAGMPVGPR